MKRIGCIFLFLFICAIGFSQSNRKVHGTVKDSANNFLPGATISLFCMNAQRDTLNSLTGRNGEFNLKDVPASDFTLRITAVGYAGHSRIYHYPENDTLINLGEIVLDNKIKVLEEVIITADRTITIKEDTIEFKADSFKVRPDADVEALLKKIPGIQVDANGNITAYGKSVNKIKVNGKDFFSGDIKTATKELPANIVDLVQVIDDYGDQAAFTGVKDGDPDKIINIKIKKDKNKGYFSRGQLGYGTDERYTVNGSLNHFNNNTQVSALINFNNTNTSTFTLPGRGGGMSRGGGGMPDNSGMNAMTTIINNGDGGFVQSGQVSNDGVSRTNSIGLNLRHDFNSKLSIYGSYSFTDRQTVTTSNVRQTNVFSGGNVVNYTNSNKTDNTTGHRAFFNVEWKIDSFNQLKFSPGFTYNKSRSVSVSDFLINNNNNSKLSEGYSINNSDYLQPNFNGNLLYNHRFRKPGRILSINLSGSTNKTDQDDDETNNSNYYDANGNPLPTSQQQIVKNETSNRSANGRISYIEPLSKRKSLEFNYTQNYNFISDNRETSLVNGQAITKLDSLSNTFENRFYYQRYGINYRYNEKKYNYSLGIALQANQMDGESFLVHSLYKRNTFNWFPLARFTYNFSTTRSLSVSYNSSVSTPTSAQLQPVYDYSNPQYPSVGNPNLNPEFKSSFSARYNNFDFMTGNIFFSNVSFSFTKDKVVTNSIGKTNNGNPGSAVQETQYTNADGYYNASGFYNFSKPYKNRKYVVTLNGNLNYTNDVSFTNSQKNAGKTFSGTQGLNFDVRLSDWLEIGSGGSFTLSNVKYSLTPAANSTVKSYTVSSNGKIYFPGKFVLNFDLNKTFNNGYGVSSNPFIINGYIERQFSKNNQLSVRLQAYDLLNQNTSISRSVSANSITDTRTNRLGQYYILSFNFRLQKFKAQRPQMQMPSGPPPDNLPPPPMR